ncbi:uncharacterized protein LOC127259390 [Andrographis paniculata]|uniref:uncharacterized protein LOC127259390 n=1 Tax=Andrographis paniculata TaxID=175694 RepID=UPI0021E968B0|nr:uncharacterized protein LOC127259390 [Andrographis paniculata]
MENWGRRRDYYLGGSQRQRRTTTGGSRQSTEVPTWEKDFCREVGGLDWGTLVETQRYMHLYPNIMNWDDSGAEEAFHNAKRRYWAKINGLPSGPSPDPNLYIDFIDWEAEGDAEPDIDRMSTSVHGRVSVGNPTGRAKEEEPTDGPGDDAPANFVPRAGWSNPYNPYPPAWGYPTPPFPTRYNNMGQRGGRYPAGGSMPWRAGSGQSNSPNAGGEAAATGIYRPPRARFWNQRSNRDSREQASGRGSSGRWNFGCIGRSDVPSWRRHSS